LYVLSTMIAVIRHVENIEPRLGEEPD